MSYSLHPEVENDLAAAARHLHVHASARIAARFLAEFERVTLLLVEHPGFGTPMSRGGPDLAIQGVQVFGCLSRRGWARASPGRSASEEDARLRRRSNIDGRLSQIVSHTRVVADLLAVDQKVVALARSSSSSARFSWPAAHRKSADPEATAQAVRLPFG